MDAQRARKHSKAFAGILCSTGFSVGRLRLCRIPMPKGGICAVLRPNMALLRDLVACNLFGFLSSDYFARLSVLFSMNESKGEWGGIHAVRTGNIPDILIWGRAGGNRFDGGWTYDHSALLDRNYLQNGLVRC
jgi:hypothetical protein